MFCPARYMLSTKMQPVKKFTLWKHTGSFSCKAVTYLLFYCLQHGRVGNETASQLFLKRYFYFYVYECFSSIYVHHMHVYGDQNMAHQILWSYGWLWITMWVLRTEPRSSRTTANAFDGWTQNQKESKQLAQNLLSVIHCNTESWKFKSELLCRWTVLDCYDCQV